ncbi:methyltransferase domain-containing protein [Candidatus Saccharibacteria bacterium]|nr:methyltransferase domain-containing protein [Candidatus Saccharibacteria bacterium]
MKYLAILGRQPEISIAELKALGWTADPADSSPFQKFLTDVKIFSGSLPESSPAVDIDRLGGTMKLAIELGNKPLEYLKDLPEGKITIGISDYSKQATRKTASSEALKLKKILTRQGRSVRVVENHEAELSTATSLHNGLSGKNERKVELIKTDEGWYRVVGIQDIEAYARRDQKRPARDAKVGMLPPKLAQILINLCGPLKQNVTILDPFCGTGVVLQEALLMGYKAYGTDISERMIEYSKKNLEYFKFNNYDLEVGDAVTHKWQKKIDAVACEGYLGKPFSKIPTEMDLKKQKQECGSIILGFLKNLASQIKSDTPVVMAIPAWLREDGSYERLKILDEIEKLGYNIDNKSREGLVYRREGQIVARDIIILRKK